MRLKLVKNLIIFLSSAIFVILIVKMSVAKGDPHSGENGKLLGDPIIMAIRNHVSSELAVSSSEVVVRILGGRVEKNGPTQGETVYVKEGKAGKLLGRNLFWISWSRSESGRVERWVTAEVMVVRSVVVATERIKRNHIIRWSDVAVKRISGSKPVENYILDPKEAVGKRVRRSIKKGSPVTRDRIEEAPVILQGEQVTLLVEKGGLRITSVGRAKEDGFLGRLVAVVNLDSRKTVYGVVENSGMVRVKMFR